MAACGVSALTATPCPSHSLAAATVSRFNAAFVAPYWNPAFAGRLSGNGGPGGSSPENDVRFRIQPRARSRIPGTTAFISSQGAQRFTCRHRSRAFGVASSKGT